MPRDCLWEQEALGTQPVVQYRYIIVPELGVEDEPPRVSTWLVRCGERVEADEPVVELVCGPVVVDLSSPVAGVLVRKLAAEDQPVTPGQRVGIVRMDSD